jgi:hypothetical protein
MKSVEALVAEWSRKDMARAVLPADREIVGASATVRTLIAEQVLAGGAPDELYDACAVLGRLFAQRGGSPTLASATLDNLAEVAGARDGAWLVPGRAALAEGFTATVLDDARREAQRSWEFPACAVPLGEAAYAFAASHPSDDDEVVSAWAARVAKASALSGARRAVVAGTERACLALVDALTLVGIEVNVVHKPR